jgi:WhiB family redox-sensing transcriptional regulator
VRLHDIFMRKSEMPVSTGGKHFRHAYAVGAMLYQLLSLPCRTTVIFPTLVLVEIIRGRISNTPGSLVPNLGGCFKVAEIAHLPGPLIDNWEWQYQGSCQNMDTELFFHPEGERGPSRKRRASQAKRVCARCPVQAECRAHSIAAREPFGIWGGLTEEERRREIRALNEQTLAS